MKITVLNGSPEGKYSITLQSVRYLQHFFKEDEFEIIEVATRIRSLEKNLAPLIDAMKRADLVLFSYPVYTLLAPYQLHRAIELLKASGSLFEGQFATQLTTSKHFYDMTAHRFVELNAKDLGFTCLQGFSADMDDLLTDKGQKQLVSYWRYLKFLWRQQKGMDAGGLSPQVPAEDKRIVNILTDCQDDPELVRSITCFQEACSLPTRVIRLQNLNIKGGCLGCFKCAADGTCVYKDGFPEFFRNEIATGAALVYAFRIQDHSMGSAFKLYDDRQFCNGHRMTTVGKPVGYLIKGDLAHEPLVQTLIAAKADVGQNLLCGVVNAGNDQEESAQIQALAERIRFTLDDGTTLPQSFWGIGGMKIFRDLIWLMRGLMQADHRFYKEHGVYDDFPQRHLGRMLQMKFIGWMANSKRLQKKMGNRMNEGKIMPYEKVIKKLDQKSI